MDRKSRNKKRDRDDEFDPALEASWAPISSSLIPMAKYSRYFDPLHKGQFAVLVLRAIEDATEKIPLNTRRSVQRDIVREKIVQQSAKLRKLNFRDKDFVQDRDDLERTLKEIRQDATLYDTLYSLTTWDLYLLNILKAFCEGYRYHLVPKDSHGETILFVLARCGFLECVNYLIRRSLVDPMARNNLGLTAAQTMLYNPDFIMGKTLQVLLEWGDPLFGEELLSLPASPWSWSGNTEFDCRAKIFHSMSSRINKFGWLTDAMRSKADKTVTLNETIVATFIAPEQFVCAKGKGPKRNLFPTKLKLEEAKLGKFRRSKPADADSPFLREWRIVATMLDTFECDFKHLSSKAPPPVNISAGTRYEFFARKDQEYPHLFRAHIAEPKENEDGNMIPEKDNANTRGIIEFDLGVVYDKKATDYRLMDIKRVIPMAMSIVVTKYVAPQSLLTLDEEEARESVDPLAFFFLMHKLSYDPERIDLSRDLFREFDTESILETMVGMYKDVEQARKPLQTLTWLAAREGGDLDFFTIILEYLSMNHRDIHDKLIKEIVAKPDSVVSSQMIPAILNSDASTSRIFNIMTFPSHRYTYLMYTKPSHYMSILIENYLSNQYVDSKEISNWFALERVQRCMRSVNEPVIQLCKFWAKSSPSHVRDSIGEVLESLMRNTSADTDTMLVKEMIEGEFSLEWLLLSNSIFVKFYGTVKSHVRLKLKNDQPLVFYHSRNSPKTLLDMNLSMDQFSELQDWDGKFQLSRVQVKKFITWFFGTPTYDEIVLDRLSEVKVQVKDAKQILTPFPVSVPSWYPKGIQAREIPGWERRAQHVLPLLLRESGIYLVPDTFEHSDAFVEYMQRVKMHLLAVNHIKGVNPDTNIPEVYRDVKISSRRELDRVTELIQDKYRNKVRAEREAEEKALRDQRVREDRERARRMQEANQAHANNIAAQEAAAEALGEEGIAQLGVARAQAEEEEEEEEEGG